LCKKKSNNTKIPPQQTKKIIQKGRQKLRNPYASTRQRKNEPQIEIEAERNPKTQEERTATKNNHQQSIWED
jgi:hypothetical protein